MTRGHGKRGDKENKTKGTKRVGRVRVLDFLYLHGGCGILGGRTLHVDVIYPIILWIYQQYSCNHQNRDTCRENMTFLNYYCYHFSYSTDILCNVSTVQHDNILSLHDEPNPGQIQQQFILSSVTSHVSSLSPTVITTDLIIVTNCHHH